jgi:hypothetical protein
MSNIGKSNEVVKNIMKSGRATTDATAYAYAFGMVWAWLTEADREHIIATAEQMVKDKDNN